MVLGNAQRYRLRALECGQKAGTARDPKDKANWHELERSWRSVLRPTLSSPRSLQSHTDENSENLDHGGER